MTDKTTYSARSVWWFGAAALIVLSPFLAWRGATGEAMACLLIGLLVLVGAWLVR